MSDAASTPITPWAPGRRRVPRACARCIEVAQRVFAERGYHAASVDAIAEGAGITKPVVYAYFGSKDGLYVACMERARQRLFEAIDEAAHADASPDEQLWYGLRAFFTFVAEQRGSWSILFGEATGRDGPLAAEATGLRGQVARLVAQLLGEAATAEGLEPAGPSHRSARPRAGRGRRVARRLVVRPS